MTTEDNHMPPCGGCLRLGVRDPGECCRTAVRDACGSASLCGRLAGDRMAAENYLSSQMGSRSANSETALMLCAEGLRALLPFSSRRVGSARWPPCVPGARGTAARVCGRPCGRVCRARGRSVRKDGRTALAPAAVATKRLPLSWPAHRGHCSRGCRHRGTGQPASLRRSRIQRGTAAAHIAPSSKCYPGRDAVSL